MTIIFKGSAVTPENAQREAKASDRRRTFDRMSFSNFTCMSSALCCSRFISRMFRQSKAKVTSIEISDKTPPSTSSKEGYKEDPDRRLSIPISKERRTSIDVTYWIPSISEKVLLRETWSDDFDFLYQLGAKIYMYIFDNEPDAKKLFPKIHQYGEKFRESDEFRSQALKFVQTMSLCIDHLDNTNYIVKVLRSIGERHVAFAERGFKPIHWNIFLDALEVALAEHIESFGSFSDEKKQEATFIWRKLAQYLITHMKRGYVEGLVKVYNTSDVSLIEFNKNNAKY